MKKIFSHKFLIFLSLGFVAFFSFLEQAQFLDAHHDILMFLNSYFAYKGLIPYKDFYIQYGVVQPYLTSIMFLIFGVSLFSQGLVIILFFCLFLFMNYKIMELLTSKNIALAYLVLLVVLEPYSILPWPNFIVGGISASAIYSFLLFIKNKINNYLFFSIFLFCLLPLIRFNAGLLIALLALLYGAYFIIKNFNLTYFFKFLISISPLVLLGVMSFDDDVIKQAILIPKNFMIPYYFKLPNDFLSLINLHFQLFFREPNLQSIVSASQTLFFWRYVLEIGIILSFIYSIKLIKSKQATQFENLVLLILFCTAISLSSSVFPIFDSFRAMTAWYPFLILSLWILYYILSGYEFRSKIICGILMAGITFFSYVNLSSSQFTIMNLIHRFNLADMAFQFKDITNFQNLENNYINVDQNGSNYFSSNSHIKSHPMSTYAKAYDAINNNCKDAYFYSASMDFIIYLLPSGVENKLAHKMFMNLSIEQTDKFYIDTNFMVYPDFYSSMNKLSSLCLFVSNKNSSLFLDNLIPFRKKIDFSDSMLFIR
jgi:hypothetical protein